MCLNWYDSQVSVTSSVRSSVPSIPSARSMNKEKNAVRTAERAAKKARVQATWQGWADAIYLTYSWDARKDRCIIGFAEVFAVTGRLTDGYSAGARSGRVCERTAWSWVHDYYSNEGFHSESLWGRHTKVAHLLDDEDIKAQCIDWINAHEPRRARAGFTALQFCIFLVGDQRLKPPNIPTGILTDILEQREQKAITERTANAYLHRLGRHYDWLKPGTFSDKHEDFQDDRTGRYLPQEQKYYDSGPNFFQDADGAWHSVDTVQDFTPEFFNNPAFIHNILGGDGNIRKINLGGQFHPDNKGPKVLFFSHDESCFPACEVRQKGWQGEKQIVRDKKRPSMLHASSRVCRYGNGSLCLWPNKPAGYMWLKGPKGLEDWFNKYNSGVVVDFPEFTDCFMNPGHSAGKDGYWMGYQFRMQAKLGLLTFEKVYRAIVPEGYVLVGDPMDVPMEFFYVDQLDWSQNHAELAKNAHDAKKMNCSPGGAQPHIKYTIHQPEAGKLLYPRWLECEPGCEECKKEFAEHGTEPGFQTIGRKGLWQMLKERHAFKKEYKMPDCVKALQQFTDFQPRMGGENSIVYDMYEKTGYAKAFFGVKYNAELAAIERKWMYLKQRIRGLLDGSIPTLRDLLAKHWQDYGVFCARKDSRHVRDTGSVYKAMGENPSLAALEVGQHEYKGHRRVFDTVTKLFKSILKSADMKLADLIAAARFKTARIQKKEGVKWREDSEKDLKSFRLRRARKSKQTNVERNICVLMMIVKLKQNQINE